MKLRVIALTLLAIVGFVGGCAYPQPYYVYERPVAAPRVDYGVVEAIDLYRGGSSAPVGLGAIIGGVAGGVIGHQFGSGSGNTAATIAGALGGAAIGHEVQKSNAADRYRVVVRLDNGAAVALDQVGQGELRVGDRVRVVYGRVYRS